MSMLIFGSLPRFPSQGLADEGMHTDCLLLVIAVYSYRLGLESAVPGGT